MGMLSTLFVGLGMIPASTLGSPLGTCCAICYSVNLIVTTAVEAAAAAAAAVEAVAAVAVAVAVVAVAAVVLVLVLVVVALLSLLPQGHLQSSVCFSVLERMPVQCPLLMV